MTRWGMNIVAFRTTGEALGWLDNNRSPRIAVVDLDLSELAAFPLLHRLAGMPGEPVRILGMAFEPQARSRSNVPIELLLKPVCPSTLLDLLRRPSRAAAAAEKRETALVAGTEARSPSPRGRRRSGEPPRRAKPPERPAASSRPCPTA
jgi:hypothetical protein